METWNEDNIPENHVIIKKVKFVTFIEGTWKRKKQDGTDEIAPKWDFVSANEEEKDGISVGVYSSTDKEELKINTEYDILAKKAIGKDGTFYGYSLKGFGPSGHPIPKKEQQSRWQKTQKLNNKAEALKTAIILFTGKEKTIPEDVIMIAEIFEAWLNGEYKPTEEPKK